MLNNPLFSVKFVSISDDTLRQEVARVENRDSKMCPVCGSQMTITHAVDIPVCVCIQHRIVMPMED